MSTGLAAALVAELALGAGVSVSPEGSALDPACPLPTHGALLCGNRWAPTLIRPALRAVAARVS